MPRDREKKATADKPRLSFEFLRVAGMSDKERAKAEKQGERQRQLSETPTGRKVLAREAKRERDKEAKRQRRETADALGLGRDSQKEPKGKNKEAQQKKNTEELMKRLDVTGKGPNARNAARALLDRLGEGSGRKPQGVEVGRDPKTGEITYDTKAGATYFGDGKAQIVARLEALVGKSYSGGKEKLGVYNVKRDPMTGRKTAEYVKPKKGAGGTKRSKLFIGPKRGVGRPRKPKAE